MRNVSPGYAVPNDGGSVVVVEGGEAGLNGCGYTTNLLAYYTILFINSHTPVVTEVTPVRYPCNVEVSTQQWKDAIAAIIDNVENSTADADAGAYWGGIMLDEESAFWPGDSVTAFNNINSDVNQRMLGTPGISLWYSETFADLGDWGGDEFMTVTGASHAAPIIATDYMALLANYYHNVTFLGILATWSLDPLYPIRGMYNSEIRVLGPPLFQWNQYLSNCWINPNTNDPCNDWDVDGVPNASDNCLSVYNPSQANNDGDAMGDACDPDDDNDGCDDVRETGPDHALGGQRDPNNFWDFFDVPLPATATGTDGRLVLTASSVRNKLVSLMDVSVVLAYIPRTTSSPYYTGDYNFDGIADGLQVDRTASTVGGQPWRSGPPNGSVSLLDVSAALAQGGDRCD